MIPYFREFEICYFLSSFIKTFPIKLTFIGSFNDLNGDLLLKISTISWHPLSSVLSVNNLIPFSFLNISFISTDSFLSISSTNSYISSKL